LLTWVEDGEAYTVVKMQLAIQGQIDGGGGGLGGLSGQPPHYNRQKIEVNTCTQKKIIII